MQLEELALGLLTIGLAAVVVYVRLETRDLRRLEYRVNRGLEELERRLGAAIAHVVEAALELESERLELDELSEELDELGRRRTPREHPSERLRRLRRPNATPDGIDES